MTERIEAAAEPAERTLVITREFNAPRDLVFKAWTDSELLARWWGPKGFTMVTSRMDLRPGGIFHYSMKDAAGAEMVGRFLYREIVEPERLVFTNAFADENGNAVPAPFDGHWPVEILNTVLFTEQDGKTLLTIHGVPVNATEQEMAFFGESHNLMRQGFGATFDQLDEYLRNQTRN